MLALLLSSEVHREALMKVLNETYVANNIFVNKLDRLVNNISADNFIFFNDDEIPLGGMGSAKALHITTRCKGYTLPGVLIDNRSALNVLPMSSLNRLPVDSSHMKTCQNIVRAFDGTEKRVMGRIEIPLLIGPNTYKKLKLVAEGQLVTINAEEDIIASVTSDVPYVGTNDEELECSFRSLEFVNATFIVERNKIPVPKISKTTRMGLQLTNINAISEERIGGENLSGIRPYVLGSILNNWTAEEIPVVFRANTEYSDINDVSDITTNSEYLFEQDLCMEGSQDLKDDRDCSLSPDLLRMVEQDEKQILLYKESVEIVSFGDENEVKIGAYIAAEMKQDLIELLQEFKDVFAWSYQDMLGLSTDIVVMPFGLKNAGATYQRAMVTLFHDMMHQKIELKLNPTKCTFGARSGKLLGFVVSEKEIGIDLDKVKAIQELPPPGTQNKVRGFLGRLNYIARFISQLTEKCDPIFRILKKHNPGVWDEECQKTFDKVEHYLSNAPVLMSPNPDRPLILHLAVFGNSMGCVLGQHDESLNFDSASNAMGNGIGAVLVSPNGDHYPFTSKLDFDCTNNMAEYKACIMGIRAAIKREIKVLEVFGDSALMADALATLASMVRVNKQEDVQPIQMSIYETPAHCYNIEKEEENNDNPWYNDILRYVKKCEYPDQATKNDKRTLRRLANDYVLDWEVLYKRKIDQVLLRCVDVVEAKQILEEVHEDVYGTHANGFTMARQIMRFGYYWSTMERDCINYTKKCHKCQIYGDKIHVPHSPLHVMTFPWPFSIWGMDVIGPILPKAFNGHRFIFVVIDYFTKWVEAASYVNVMKSTVMEAANKNIKKIVGKMTETYKDWHEKLSFALYAYRTSVRTSTEATPFSLDYGMESVLPIEMEIPSFRVLAEVKLDEAEWI
ncbi:RNA-directed DNA polymerase (Reverse transcriptase), Ribonuclease H [Gossypium australe]|uniref:RNA-directed DNA polymerase (Reverse transcriptase), Ribonuclease H n=1 Tax=Gossypium australe TaxID=47621 RepID=A0A5B6X391_9ROSI|nr:RNA-directed DNA polymerase (Reverse transcriptase), Ribonuclease H [Gossypium australe]